MASKSKTGKELERRVANAYRAMGARKVRHDVELAGNQIDAYVELEAPGHLLHRIAVEAKDWSRPVGIDVVNDFAQIANLLRGERLIDEGVIVSAKGFSKQARNAAQTYGILLLEPTDLDSMAAEAVAATRQLNPTFLAESQATVSPGRPKRRRTVAIVVILDGDEAGRLAAEAMHRFGAQKNRHFFQLERKDYKDKGGKSWDVEIEDMLPQALVEAFVRQHPDAVEERFQRREVVKFVINGKPVEKGGQTYDYKMMLAEHVRQHAKLEDLASLVELLHKARKCMGIKG
jgi:hypothetical protein